MTDPADRDRTLARVRKATAVTGIGAVVAGGALAGWLGHAAGAGAAGSTGTGTTEQDGTGTDDGLSTPAESPATGSGGDSSQPGVVSGGS